MDFEVCYNIVALTVRYLTLVLAGVNLVLLIRPYVRERRHACAAGGIFGGLLIVLQAIPLEMYNWIAYTVGLSVSFFYLVRVDGRNREQKLFLYFTFYIFRSLCSTIVLEIIRFVSEKVYSVETIRENAGIWEAYLISEQIGWMIVSFFMLYAGTYFLNRIYKRKWENLSVRELIYLIIPQTSVLFIRPVENAYYELYLKCIEEGIVHKDMPASGYRILYCSAIYVTMLVLIFVFQQIRSGQEKNNMMRLADSQTTEMKNHIRQTELLYEDIRSMRHDMGNHIQVMEHLVQGGDKREAAAYLKRLKREWQQMAPEVNSGNPVTDVILKEKQQEAEKRNISFQLDFHFPENDSLDAFDVGVILSNALNNSLESASGERPWIEVSSSLKEHIFLITVRNSFEGVIRWDQEGEIPLTSKKEEGHGIGLSNIRRVARFHRGDILFEQQPGSVVLQVLLLLE